MIKRYISRKYSDLLRTFALMNDIRKLKRFYYSSPLGEMVLCGDEDKLCGLWFVGQKHFPDDVERLEFATEDCVFVERTLRWLEAYFSHSHLPEMPNIRLVGTPFQNKVWQALRDVNYGERVSYSDIALTVSRLSEKASVSVRAVASAIGRNPVSILIPCHRVLGKDGSLRGYAGGLERKQWLLEWESRGITAELQMEHCE